MTQQPVPQPDPAPQVNYIPSQLNAPAWADPLMLRDSPMKLLWEDTKLVFKEMRTFMGIFLPFKTDDRRSELYPSRPNVQDIVYHILLFFISIDMLGLGLLVFLFTPGLVLLAFYALCWGMVIILCKLLNFGPRVLRSDQPLDAFAQRPGEKWVFVNGINAGTRWLQENINMISTVFGRPVTGIHNRTYGIIFDLLDCIIQRDFLYGTSDIRFTYNYLKVELLDPEVTHVVVLAHSQGGIIVSAVLDALYADLAPSAFEKLEIYTFGCAANHFCNPPRCTLCGSSNACPEHGLPADHLPVTVPTARRQVRVIEHYVNELDFVARISVLRYVRGVPQNAYVGKVFVRQGRSGHMFNQHYLETMFEDPKCEFLEAVVNVEERTVGRRLEATAGADIERGEAEIEQVDGAHAVAAVGQVKEAQGRTVKELSRLWRYKGGMMPKEVELEAAPGEMDRLGSASA